MALVGTDTYVDEISAVTKQRSDMYGIRSDIYVDKSSAVTRQWSNMQSISQM